MSFANYLLIAVYFIFILDYGNEARQNANLRNFLIWIKKWVVKQQRQLAISTMHLAQELQMNLLRSGDWRSFENEMRVLKMRRIVAGHQK